MSVGSTEVDGSAKSEGEKLEEGWAGGEGVEWATILLAGAAWKRGFFTTSAFAFVFGAPPPPSLLFPFINVCIFFSSKSSERLLRLKKDPGYYRGHGENED